MTTQQKEYIIATVTRHCREVRATIEAERTRPAVGGTVTRAATDVEWAALCWLRSLEAEVSGI